MPLWYDRYAPLPTTAIPTLTTAMPPRYDRYAPALRPLCPPIAIAMPPCQVSRGLWSLVFLRELCPEGLFSRKR